MKYLLKKEYELCGWQKMPYVLRNKTFPGKGGMMVISRAVYELLILCNGRVDFDFPFFREEQRTALRQMKEDGIIDEAGPEAEGREIVWNYHDNRYIESAHWAVTGRCNSKCRHCFVSAPDAKLGELSHETVFGIIDELAGVGIATVDLTGGECLVRSDFMELVKRLHEKEIRIRTIYTNGYLVSEKLLTDLLTLGVRPEFNMSFDGVGYHDWMRGITGAEKMTSDAFRLCREMGFRTACEMCLFRSNAHTLRESVRYLASLGVSDLKVNPVINSELWEPYNEKETLSDDEVFQKYLEYVPQFYEDGAPMNVMLGGFFYGYKDAGYYSIPACKSCREEDLKNVCLCGHARNVLFITADGRTIPCMPLSDRPVAEKFPLITEIGLKKCLSDSFYMDFIDTRAPALLAHNEKCTRCDFRNNCIGGCRASALQVHPDDLLAPDESVCRFFSGGYFDALRKLMGSRFPEIRWDRESE